jgi:hypothetical protein
MMLLIQKIFNFRKNLRAKKIKAAARIVRGAEITIRFVLTENVEEAAADILVDDHFPTFA